MNNDTLGTDRASSVTSPLVANLVHFAERSHLKIRFSSGAGQLGVEIAHNEAVEAVGHPIDFALSTFVRLVGGEFESKHTCIWFDETMLDQERTHSAPALATTSRPPELSS